MITLSPSVFLVHLIRLTNCIEVDDVSVSQQAVSDVIKTHKRNWFLSGCDMTQRVRCPGGRLSVRYEKDMRTVCFCN